MADVLMIICFDSGLVKCRTFIYLVLIILQKSDKNIAVAATSLKLHYTCTHIHVRTFATIYQ